tara:strand:+ start:40657 stop:41943 length:1287 start_codon:yes stop_codon:yes gene_type:complete
MKRASWVVIPIVIALCGLALWFVESEPEFSEEEVTVVPQEDTVIIEPTIEFGIPVDSFRIVRGQVEQNQFLADILLGYNVPYPTINEMVEKASDVFDVRNIRYGKNYSVFCTNDTTGVAECFIYQPNAVDYVVFDLRDSVSVYKGKKEIRTEIRQASGKIESSLWDALNKNNISPSLALELASIYAWSIDFYRIQKGDFFKVIYEANYVEDQFVGIGEIKAAMFNHSEEPFYAFAFEQDSIVDYYDENAKSLRKAFLQAPLEYGRISSGYTMRRFHPVQKRYKAHLGTDYAAPTGTPIMVVGDGTVIEAKFSRYNGNYVKVRHNGTYTTQYLHMSKIAKGMKPGKVVRQGDIIGYVGSTGLATGPHVCFRFWKNGQQVDHRKEKLPPSKPVKEEYLKAYNAHMRKMRKEIDAIPLRDFSKQQELAQKQ